MLHLQVIYLLFAIITTIIMLFQYPFPIIGKKVYFKPINSVASSLFIYRLTCRICLSILDSISLELLLIFTIIMIIILASPLFAFFRMRSLTIISSVFFWIGRAAGAFTLSMFFLNAWSFTVFYCITRFAKAMSIMWLKLTALYTSYHFVFSFAVLSSLFYLWARIVFFKITGFTSTMRMMWFFFFAILADYCFPYHNSPLCLNRGNGIYYNSKGWN